jgi:hypothetical protein
MITVPAKPRRRTNGALNITLEERLDGTSLMFAAGGNESTGVVVGTGDGDDGLGDLPVKKSY